MFKPALVDGRSMDFITPKFGDVDWNKAEESFPPEQPQFLLRCLDGDQVMVKNISPDRNVEVDCYTLEPNQEVTLEDGNIVSVYGWEMPGVFSNHKLAYLYGFDPTSRRIVRHDPDRHGAHVKVERATKIYDGGVAGIRDVTFEIMPSTLVGVYGQSGVGKSVLINSIVSPVGSELDRGSVTIDDIPVAGNPHVAYLPQHLNFPANLKVREIIRQGVCRTGCSRGHKRQVLELCHLTEMDDRLFRQLSGGQQRRLALAMALLDSSVSLVIADEPTTGLDISTERDVMRGLRRLVRLHNITVVVVTHSVSALPIFDKVLVLAKPDKGRAATLCFDSQWLPAYFPDKLRRIPQDAARLAALFEGLVAQDIPVRNKFGTPHDHIVGGGRLGVVNKLHSWGRQALSWEVNCSRLVLRQKKTLGYFWGLSILCAFMIQQGTGCSSRRSEVFLSFMALCAPWLCATYTAMFSADLLRWFSWGKLYGGSSRSFEAGVLSGLMLPYMGIALVFTLGIFVAPRMDRVVSESYTMLKSAGLESRVSRFFREGVLDEYERSIRDPDWAGGNSVLDDIPQVRVGNEELGCDSQGELYRNDYASISRGLAESAQSVFPWRLFVVQWLQMLLICLVGGMMGLAATALFREARTAALGIVILYICFIMLSRICVEQSSCMYALTYSSEGQIDRWTDAKWIPLVYMSYLGIGRYVYNVLVYPLQWRYLLDWLPLLGWFALCGGIAWRRLANTQKNWEAIAK